MQEIKTNEANITAIIKVLKSKVHGSRKANPVDDIIKQFYEKLLVSPILQDENYARCINSFLDYPDNRPGKIYVWPDNLINLHAFITGKTKVFSYYYPDKNIPRSMLWKVESHYDGNFMLIKKKRIQKYSSEIEPVTEQQLAKILRL